MLERRPVEAAKGLLQEAAGADALQGVAMKARLPTENRAPNVEVTGVTRQAALPAWRRICTLSHAGKAACRGTSG